MSDWSIRIEAVQDGPPVGDDRAASILESLDRYAGAVSAGGDSVGASFVVKAGTLSTALAGGLKVFDRALRRGGIDAYRIVDVELQPWADFERSLERPANTADLVGVTEVAAILGVSRQRASELADSPDFPKPIAKLAAGPIWRRAAVARYVGSWPRRVGRPPKQQLARSAHAGAKR